MIHPLLAAESFQLAPKSAADTASIIGFAMSVPGALKDAALYVIAHATGVAVYHAHAKKKRKAHKPGAHKARAAVQRGIDTALRYGRQLALTGATKKRKLLGAHLPASFYHERLRRERFAADNGWTPSIARMLARPLAHNELFREHCLR